MSKREMTVGVTVNLKNYESLRIEIEDDVESEEDVRSLVAFLDQTLALFGRGNPETEELISHYRRRVLQGAIGEETGVPAPAPAAPKIAAAKPVETPAVEPPAPVPSPAESPEEAPAPKPAPKPAAKAPATAPAKTPAPSPTGAVCEECGAPVSAAEEKTSRLFVSRTLCKKCIQSL